MANDDAVARQRGGRIIRREVKFGISRLVAQQMRRAVAVELDGADHEIRFGGECEAVLAHANDVAGKLETVQGAGESDWGRLLGAEGATNFLQRRR